MQTYPVQTCHPDEQNVADAAADLTSTPVVVPRHAAIFGYVVVSVNLVCFIDVQHHWYGRGTFLKIYVVCLQFLAVLYVLFANPFTDIFFLHGVFWKFRTYPSREPSLHPDVDCDAAMPHTVAKRQVRNIVDDANESSPTNADVHTPTASREVVECSLRDFLQNFKQKQKISNDTTLLVRCYCTQRSLIWAPMFTKWSKNVQVLRTSNLFWNRRLSYFRGFTLFIHQQCSTDSCSVPLTCQQITTTVKSQCQHRDPNRKQNGKSKHSRSCAFAESNSFYGYSKRLSIYFILLVSVSCVCVSFQIAVCTQRWRQQWTTINNNLAENSILTEQITTNDPKYWQTRTRMTYFRSFQLYWYPRPNRGPTESVSAMSRCFWTRIFKHVYLSPNN